MKVHSAGAGYLEVAEALFLGSDEEIVRDGVHVVPNLECLEFEGGLHYELHLLEEPAVYLCKFVYLVYAVAGAHRLADDEDAHVGRLPEGLVYIGDDEFLVLGEAVHALAYHPEAFLEGFLEGSAYGHHFSDRFHG